MRLSIAAALLLLAIPAQAQTRDWQLVGGNTQIRTYIDTGSIVRSGDTAAASELSAFHQPISGVYAFELHIVYDCKAPRFRERDGIYYSATGQVTGTDPGAEPEKYYDTHPNSIDDAGRLYACFGEHGVAKIADPFADAAREFDWNP